MNELLIGLGLLTFPAAVFVVFGNAGPGSFGKDTGVPAYSSAEESTVTGLTGDCAVCHGRQAQGTDRGPNLIDANYGFSMRSNDQFRDAVRKGMPSRLGYGAMPADPGMSDLNLDRTVAFLRKLQRENGVR